MESSKVWRDFGALKHQLYEKGDAISKLESYPDLI